MNKWKIFLFLLIACFVSPALTPPDGYPAPEENPLMAGAAKIIITPQKPIPMSG
ncbi:MAG: hypothetical protein WD824_21795 [Cyclobacteriaceae bacterium]